MVHTSKASINVVETGSSEASVIPMLQSQFQDNLNYTMKSYLKMKVEPEINPLIVLYFLASPSFHSVPLYAMR